MRSILLFAVLLPSLFAQPASEVEAVVTTSLGTFRFELFPDQAPRHVAHFLKLARAGYYDGSAFFRVAPRALIQGGDPLLKDAANPRNLWGTGGLNLLPLETSDLKHERGTVSTVNIPGKPDSDGAQFFVCVNQQPPLDGKYSAFGRVNEGMGVVEKISLAARDESGLVADPVRILKITIEKKKTEPYLDTPVDQLRKTVSLKTTLGTITLKMEPEWAPNTVRNFLRLVSTGWYDTTAFHRISKDFVIQGGMSDSRPGGADHPADRWVHPIKGEFRSDVKHVRGIVSMARRDDPDSGDTSFFLMLGPAPHLDGKYAAFARVVEGMEVLAAFEKEEVEGETPKRRLEVVEAKIVD